MRNLSSNLEEFDSAKLIWYRLNRIQTLFDGRLVLESTSAVWREESPRWPTGGPTAVLLSVPDPARSLTTPAWDLDARGT